MSSMAAEIELFMPPAFFGLIALIIFTVLALFTWSFRDVANRHKFKAAAYAGQHSDTETGHGGHSA